MLVQPRLPWRTLSPCLLALAACGGARTATEAPAVAEVRAVPTTAPSSAPPVPTADSCVDADACLTVGRDLAAHGDDAHARIAFEKACSGGSADACATLVTLAPPTKQRLAETARAGCKLEGATEANRAARGAACEAWAHALVTSDGGSDTAAALSAHQTGCQLGNADACTNARELVERRGFDADVEQYVTRVKGGATMNSMSMVNGASSWLTCHQEAAKMPARDLFDPSQGSTVLGEKLPSLRACVGEEKTQLRIVWSSNAAHKISDVKVLERDDAVNTCVKRVLLGTKVAHVETCVARLALIP